MRRSRMTLAAVATAVLTAGCGGGVSQAVHDQTVTELALTQQRLSDLERASAQTSDIEAELEERISSAFREIGLLRDPDRNALEQLTSAFVDSQMEVARLQEEFELRLDEESPGNPDTARVIAYFEVAQQLLAEAYAYPDVFADTLMALSGPAGDTLDMEVQTVIDDLVILLETEPDAFKPAAVAGVMQILMWGQQAATGDREPGVHSG